MADDNANNSNGGSLEKWLFGAADMLRGAEDASKYKDFILPLVFTKRLCDVFDDELDRIATEVGGRAMDSEPGMEVYDPCCGSGGLLIKCESAMERKMAAVVLDTGAVSRGSGSANANKEKKIRRWYAEHDLIEAVLYLPENLFYNTSAPGIVMFLNTDKPADKRGRVLLVNASRVYEKGDPKNFIPEEGIERIARTLLSWSEEEKFSRIVELETIRENDYNISPSRYIHTADEETYRPISEIVADLRVIEAEAEETDRQLKEILTRIGVDG